MFDPESNTFVLERVATLSRLAATRPSRGNTMNSSAPNPSYPIERPNRPHPKSNEDVPTISLDTNTGSSTNAIEAIDIGSPEEPVVPLLVTPRLPTVAPMQPHRPLNPEPESSDDDSEINFETTTTKAVDPDDDVSDEDLDDLANELESSLENRPGSSSSEVDLDDISLSKTKSPDFGNVPRSGGPISMSRFAGGRRREEEESSSSDDDDD